MRRLRLPGSFLFLAFASAATASGEAPAVHLVQPWAEMTLRAGASAVLEWEPGSGGLDSAPWVEEWEAFLSIDGGMTWPYRVTPHLDLDLRRMSWRVPNVRTSEARILLRFGDERREIALELPQRFAIAAPFISLPEMASQSAGRGESARPGEPGVVSWVEGSRRGGAMRRFVTFEARLWPDGAVRPLSPSGLAPAVLPVMAQLEGPAPVREPPPPLSCGAVMIRSARRAPCDIFSLLQRRNE